MSGSDAAALDREYQALRAGRGAVDLTGWSSISVTGADRQTFLHNFCTNDVKRLVPGSSCEAFFCNAKGKIVGHGVIGCRNDELAFVGAPGQAAALIAHLDRYIIREDVKLVDDTSSRSYFFVAAEVEDSQTRIAWDLLGIGHGRVFECSSAGEEQYGTVGAEAFEAARIEAGLPLFGVDFDGENLPQEIGRDRQAISFTKGCYLGQETVARLDALGHVNRQLVAVRFDGDRQPERGMELTMNGAKFGRITSFMWSPKLRAPLALAMIRRVANVVGTRLESPLGNCEVVATPIK
jgi:folate-binding protein YgfZ